MREPAEPPTQTFPRTTGEIVRRYAEQRPEHPALRWAGKVLTYRQLDENSSRVAQALRAAGVGPGDRVAFLDKNGPEQIEVFFGAAKLGAVPTPVNFRLAAPEVAFVLDDAQARICFVGDEFVDLVADCGTRVVSFDEEYRRWRDAAPAQDPGHPQADDDVAFQLYSSGTTGRPKGVELTNANSRPACRSTRSSSGCPRTRSRWRPCRCSTSVEAAGCSQGSAGMYQCARAGTDSVRAHRHDRARPHHARGTGAGGRPVHAAGARQRRARLLLDARNAYGASPISETVLTEGLRTFGCDFVQCYGLTETTATIAVLPARDHDDPKRLRSAGVPTAGHEIRVVDPITSEPVAAGEVGEIQIRGPNVMRGYWNMPEATAETIVDGWLRSGDAGYLDDDGYLYLHDRIKDMILSGAENIYPVEMENVLMAHPAVADVAVVGVPSERWGETPLAIVVPSDEVGPDELIEYCRERLARFKCPTRVEWAEVLPRTPSGKVLKKDLRAPYWEGRDRQVN